MTKFILTQRGCPACTDLRHEYREKGIKFKEIDINSAKGNEIADALDVNEVPTFVCNEKKVSEQTWKVCK